MTTGPSVTRLASGGWTTALSRLLAPAGPRSGPAALWVGTEYVTCRLQCRRRHAGTATRCSVRVAAEGGDGGGTNDAILCSLWPFGAGEKTSWFGDDRVPRSSIDRLKFSSSLLWQQLARSKARRTARRGGLGRGSGCAPGPPRRRGFSRCPPAAAEWRYQRQHASRACGGPNCVGGTPNPELECEGRALTT